MAVTGIGGVFFRARDPDALTAWYKQHLGVTMVGWEPWQQQAGPTVFQPFKADTDNWLADKPFMINFRVDDLAKTIAALEGAGVAVETRPEWDSPEAGKFARIHDPEGNPVELWEPPAE
jgi:predicted enzyme related to lactoylglutathione lyase